MSDDITDDHYRSPSLPCEPFTAAELVRAKALKPALRPVYKRKPSLEIKHIKQIKPIKQ